jgi:phosphoribosylpyrophosphate synthetase
MRSRERLDILERSVQKLSELSGMEPFLGADVVLVPAPRSAPIRDVTTLWPAQRICAQLVAGKLGREVLPCLTRTVAVPKSAFAPSGERPDVSRHFETIAAEVGLVRGARIAVVDDVITKGATLLAAASRVQEAFPEAEVRAFALLRTMGLVEEVDKILDPCRGTITLVRGEVMRAP